MKRVLVTLLALVAVAGCASVGPPLPGAGTAATECATCVADSSVTVDRTADPTTSAPGPVPDEAATPTASTAAVARSRCPRRGTPQPVRFPLQVSPDRRYLVDQASAPFLVHADAAWSLMVQLDVDEAREYLDVRRSQGFNSLVVELVEHQFADDAPRNAFGVEPFTTPGDFSTPNPVYFDHVERVLRMAQDRGFAVLLAPAYIGYDGEESGWYQEMRANGEAVMRDYGRWVGARFARLDNIIWLDGGDYTPPPEGVRLVSAVAEGILAEDPRHLHSAHWKFDTAGAQVPVDWLDVDTTYTYDWVYQKSLEDYARTGGTMPRILIESAYEQDIFPTTPRQLRGQAYYALLTGAVGHSYGHGLVWKFTAEWRDGLDTAGSCSMVRLWDLFSALPWWELEPDVDHRVLVDGAGTFGDDDYAVAAASRTRDLAVVYLPADRQVGIALDAFAGPVRAHAYDPVSGELTRLEPEVGEDGTARLRPPGLNAVGDWDWVLVLDSVEDPVLP